MSTQPHRPQVGTRDQWDRADRAANSTRPIDRARSDAAYRNARLCGTDPSWYGF